MIVSSVLELIGNTPCIRLSGIDTHGAEIYVKAERFNPLGSAKDRAAYSMIRNALDRGEINQETVIIEPTSGNTGIALSGICSMLHLRCIIVMPESMSEERRMLVKALGASLVLSPASEGMNGAIKKARQIASSLNNAFIPMQFDNPDNALAHYRTTAVEIEKDFSDSLDMVVAGIGSGGTITGIARYFREKGYKARFIGVEPALSPVLSQGYSGRHGIQGIGAGFVPGVLDRSLVDEIVTVSDEEAYKHTRLLARSEGLLCGISSGAALAAALKTAKKGDKVLAILPDTGERYLSQSFWQDDRVID